MLTMFLLNMKKVDAKSVIIGGLIGASAMYAIQTYRSIDTAINNLLVGFGVGAFVQLVIRAIGVS